MCIITHHTTPHRITSHQTTSYHITTHIKCYSFLTVTLQKGGRAKAKMCNRMITCARKYRYTHRLIYHPIFFIIVISYDYIVLECYLIDLSIYSLSMRMNGSIFVLPCPVLSCLVIIPFTHSLAHSLNPLFIPSPLFISIG